MGVLRRTARLYAILARAGLTLSHARALRFGYDALFSGKEQFMGTSAGFVRELHALLPLWQAQGWLSAAQAEGLRAQYPLPAQAPWQWWQVLLSVLAALCVGGGVIALFAANWDVLSRPLRVVLSVTPLFLAQAAFLWSWWRRPQSLAWRESSALLIAIAVGAAIALIAQTYHIESQGMFLHLWLWLTLPLPFLTRSWAAAFFTAFLGHVFGVEEVPRFGYFDDLHVLYYVLYAAVPALWLAWQWRRGVAYAGQHWVWRSLMNAHVLLFALVLLLLQDFNARDVLMLSGALFLLSRAWCGQSLAGMAAAVLLAWGYLWLAEDGAYGAIRVSQAWTVLVVSVLALAAAALRWRQWRLWDGCFALGGIALYGLWLVSADIPAPLWVWGITAVVVALGLWQLHLALHDGRMLAINAALLWVLLALFWRFMEDDMPLWIKGLVFIAAGAALFALNMLAMRRKRGLV